MDFSWCMAFPQDDYAAHDTLEWYQMCVFEGLLSVVFKIKYMACYFSLSRSKWYKSLPISHLAI